MAMAEAGTAEIVIKEIRNQRHAFLNHLLRRKCSHIKVSFELRKLEKIIILAAANE